MKNDEISKRLISFISPEQMKFNESMKNHTSFKVGGPAEIFIAPNSIEQISKIIKLSNELKLSVFVLGNGTNLIVDDLGIKGITIKIFDNFNKIEIDGNIIKAQAGALLSGIAQVALENELGGFEFASGIPGTIGGAVTMNAGAYGFEMKNVVYKTSFVDKNGDIRELIEDEHMFGYRTSFIQQNRGIVVYSELKLRNALKKDIKCEMEELRFKRESKQPLEMPSAGSVFKRPEGFYSGKLIEDCGLRGYKIGDAQVSEKHCGFIVNCGEATAKDIKELIMYIKDNVRNRFQVELETEVRFVGGNE